MKASETSKQRRKPPVKAKPAITLVEMAGLVGLSRSRFYELIRLRVFPSPVFEMFERKAVYIAPLQRLCLQVRQAGVGMNGNTVRFQSGPTAKKHKP
jgi:hypothetical protein